MHCGLRITRSGIQFSVGPIWKMNYFKLVHIGMLMFWSKFHCFGTHSVQGIPYFETRLLVGLSSTLLLYYYYKTMINDSSTVVIYWNDAGKTFVFDLLVTFYMLFLLTVHNICVIRIWGCKNMFTYSIGGSVTRWVDDIDGVEGRQRMRLARDRGGWNKHRKAYTQQ